MVVIDKIPGETVRQGFLEEFVYRAIRDKLPAHQVPLFTVAYYTGIRAGELLNPKWEYVDFFGEIPLIKIPGEVAKTGKPRTIPLYHPEMIETVKFAYQARNPSCPWMFQFRGKRLRDYRQGWEDARAAAGYPNVLFHDATHSGAKHGTGWRPPNRCQTDIGSPHGVRLPEVRHRERTRGV